MKGRQTQIHRQTHAHTHIQYTHAHSHIYMHINAISAQQMYRQRYNITTEQRNTLTSSLAYTSLSLSATLSPLEQRRNYISNNITMYINSGEVTDMFYILYV